MLYHIRGKFDAAHALMLPYESKCRYLHGHTYRVSITLEVNDQDVFDGKLNMGIDFARIKGVLDAVLAVRDHALFLSNAGKVEFFGEREPQPGWRLTQGEPTAEYLAQDIYKALACEMGQLSKEGPEIILVAVTLGETDDQGVTYYPNVAFGIASLEQVVAGAQSK